MVRLTVLILALLAVAVGAPAASAHSPGLGANVTVFDPSMPVDEIQAKLDATHAAQVDNEMGTERYASCSSRAPTAPPRTRCRSRSATTPRSRGWAPHPPTW